MGLGIIDVQCDLGGASCEDGNGVEIGDGREDKEDMLKDKIAIGITRKLNEGLVWRSLMSSSFLLKKDEIVTGVTGKLNEGLVWRRLMSSNSSRKWKSSRCRMERTKSWRGVRVLD